VPSRQGVFSFSTTWPAALQFVGQRKAAVMSLTKLKYIVAVACEKHFGRAAEACSVS
jgi:hypothetical protein